MTDHRDAVHARLLADLVGPAGAIDEEIIERPSDRYLSGILFPLRSELPPDEDERLEGGGDGDDNDGEDLSLPPSVRPASAGLSFAVDGDAPSIDIEISCAEYRFIEGGSSSQLRSGSAEPVAPGAEGDRTSGAARGPHAWKREPRRIVIPGVVVMDAMRTISLDDYGLPKCELVFRSTRSGALRLVTVVLVNRRVVTKESPREASEENALFQVRLAVRPGVATTIAARPSRISALDEDGRSAALLYRDAREYAVGHVCAATWTLIDGRPVEVSSTWIPAASVPSISSEGGVHFRRLMETSAGDCFKADVLECDDTDLASVLRALPDAYATWIAGLREELHTLAPEEREQGRRHIEEGCETCLASIRAGIELLARDAEAARAFRLANRAMNLQYRWRNDKALVWRPFQLGFLLMTIGSSADASNEERDLMDLLWFPTGGGKTEAYLALVAFVLFSRRFRHPRNPDMGAGTAVIMRYTLRLLTTQQFQRAASLVLACDHLRRTVLGLTDHCGSVPFSIGLWVGDDAVANKRSDAFTALERRDRNSPDQLAQCPCCKRALEWARGPRGAYLQVRCTTIECALHGYDLPVWTVDEDIYERLPALIIGTVDKFAQMPNKAEIGGLFGLGTDHDSPDLIIQDELHLISGPLGTLAGLYESSIDLLCSLKGRRPKVIGSTATIRRAADQVKALFDRDVRLFPPPGLNVADSCFAVREEVADRSPARRYFAVSTAGRSAKFTLQAVSASILQTAPTLHENSAVVDAYWTLVTYFNSLQELGGALILMHDDVPKSIRQFAARHGEEPRAVGNVRQLTSTLTQAELKETLSLLEYPVSSEMAIDAVLATNMISVGLDISRLGVMVVNGQPKSIAEYIQATSRVGRKDWPGLVVAVYNHNKARDRSRFESFESWHQTLYREVEATSVTPFSPRARDRGLRACLVSLARHAVPALNKKPELADSEDEVVRLAELLAERAARVDPEEATTTDQDLREFVEEWSARGALTDYSWSRKKGRPALTIRAEKAAEMRAKRREVGDMWVIPSTMRNVEPGTPVKLVKALRAETTEERE